MTSGPTWSPGMTRMRKVWGCEEVVDVERGSRTGAAMIDGCWDRLGLVDEGRGLLLVQKYTGILFAFALISKRLLL